MRYKDFVLSIKVNNIKNNLVYYDVLDSDGYIIEKGKISNLEYDIDDKPYFSTGATCIWIEDIEDYDLKINRKKIFAEKSFIEDLIKLGLLDDIEDLQKEGNFTEAVEYWQRHYFDDYSDGEIIEMIRENDGTIICKNVCYVDDISRFIELENRAEWNYALDDLDEALSNNSFLVVNYKDNRVYEVTKEEFERIHIVKEVDEISIRNLISMYEKRYYKDFRNEELGLFICESKSKFGVKYIAVDNRDGDCYVEEFKTKEIAYKYLLNENYDLEKLFEEDRSLFEEKEKNNER